MVGVVVKSLPSGSLATDEEVAAAIAALSAVYATLGHAHPITPGADFKMESKDIVIQRLVIENGIVTEIKAEES